MQFKLYSNSLLAPLIGFLAIFNVFPSFVLASNGGPPAADTESSRGAKRTLIINHKWPDVAQDLPIYPEACNKTSMIVNHCTLTNLLKTPIEKHMYDQKSSLILYDGGCKELARQDDVKMRGGDVILHSTLGEDLKIEGKYIGPGNEISFNYAGHGVGKRDFHCYNTGWDIHHTQIKACSAVFGCSTLASSAARSVRGGESQVFLICVLVLVWLLVWWTRWSFREVIERFGWR